MFYINEDHYTQQHLDQWYVQFSNLHWLDLKRRPRIAVCTENTAQWIAFCLFCRDRDLAVMPISTSMPQPAALRLATECHCDYLIFHSFDTPEKISNFDVNTSSGGLIQMTSGTTGKPKCIERSWTAIKREVDAYIEAFPQSQTMTPVVASPVTHSYGLISGVMVGLERSASPHIITTINPRFLVKRLQSIKSHLLYSSPAQLENLLRIWPQTHKINAVMTSGTQLSEPNFQAIRERTTHLFQQYGCSEAGCIAINPNVQTANAIGYPLPHLNVKAGTNANNPAEIKVSIPAAENSETYTIPTRDLGYTYDDPQELSLLYFVARMDDTIVVAGLNVYPYEVESVVLRYPTITDAVAFKITDSLAGNRICLHFTATTFVNIDLLKQWCREQLASFQCPYHIQQVDSLPRMPNGKISRTQLGKEFTEAQLFGNQKAEA